MGEAAQSAQRKIKANKLTEETIEEIEDVAMGIDLVASDVAKDGYPAAQVRLAAYSSRLKKLVERLSR